MLVSFYTNATFDLLYTGPQNHRKNLWREYSIDKQFLAKIAPPSNPYTEGYW